MRQTIADCHRGFRQRYLGYEGLCGQLRAWADAWPDLVHLRSLATTGHGRDVWLLTIGPEPERMRPAAWVDANMHAVELCGSSVALAIAEDVIRCHLEPDWRPHGLPAAATATVRDVLFHVVPRMSPDGAEEVLLSGRFLRSVPRDRRPPGSVARWRPGDVDGDGLARMMRQPDADGEFVESAELPGLLLMRELEDEGPFYRLYPEGVIDRFDGVHIPSPSLLSDNPTDLNRNFPYAWMPPFVQEGAGDYPMSEPESRAVVEFTSAAPAIFAWLNLHTFGGVFIRPLGDKGDDAMDRTDLALFRQIEAWNRRYTGYPTVSGFEEFTYRPNQPLYGDLIEYAYHQRGCIAYVCELWDLFEQVGLERTRRFVDRYTHLDRDDVLKIYRWDRDHNGGRLGGAWRPFDHPQLGAVEIGGPDPRFGLWNPPEDRIAAICQSQAAAFLRLAALAPRLDVVERLVRLGDGLSRLEVEVVNRGYLPTWILDSARRLEWNEPVTAELRTEGCVLDGSLARQVAGHLEGWGRGRFEGSAMPYFQGSRGNGNRARLGWTLRGGGEVRLRVGAPRCGWLEKRIAV